jgi:hypothetical protein
MKVDHLNLFNDPSASLALLQEKSKGGISFLAWVSLHSVPHTLTTDCQEDILHSLEMIEA